MVSITGARLTGARYAKTHPLGHLPCRGQLSLDQRGGILGQLNDFTHSEPLPTISIYVIRG